MAADTLTILSAGAVKPGLDKVIDAYRRDTGRSVNISFATAPAIRGRIAQQAKADIVIAPIGLLDELATAGRTAGDRVSLGGIGVGVMVRSEVGTPKIASVEEFTRALLDADSIVYNQASTGTYVEHLFERLAIAAQLRKKTVRYPDFASVLDHVKKGHGNELGLGATTVIIENQSHGIRFVGPLPAEIQNYTEYAAVMTAQARDRAGELLRHLMAPTARALWRAAGIE